jgi:hypothetical protein
MTCQCQPIMFGNPVCGHCKMRHGSGWDCRLHREIEGAVTAAVLKKAFRTKPKANGARSATLTKREHARAEAAGRAAYRKLVGAPQI